MQRLAHSWPLSLKANLYCHRRQFSQHKTNCDQAPQRTSLLDSFDIRHRKRASWSRECIKPYLVPNWSVFGYRNDDRYLGRPTQTDNTATRPAFDQECSARNRYHGPGQWALQRSWAFPGGRLKRVIKPSFDSWNFRWWPSSSFQSTKDGHKVS